ncbi:MAG: hypothetical protein WAV90_23485 [Gordonia amarae]
MYIVSRPDPRDLSDEELYEAIFVVPSLPLLCHMTHLARAWQTCHAYGALAAALSVAACAAPEATVETGIGDGAMPLNFVIGLTGPSGAGKGLASSDRFMIPGTPLAAAPGVPLVGGSAQMINTAPRIRRHGRPASGEALITMFYEPNPNYIPPNAKAPANPAPANTTSKWQRNGKALLINWGEIDQFAAKSGAKGSTLEATARSGWSGEELGDESITRVAAGLPCTVDAMTYRLVLLFGVQPEKGAALFDSAGGTLQRVIWLPVYDPDKLCDPAELQAAKAAAFQVMHLPVPRDLRRAKRPSLYVPGPTGDIIVTDDVIDAIQYETGRPDRDPEETHATANRIRLAAIFAGWVRRPGQPCVVDMDAWYWAGLVMEVSRRTREEVRTGIRRGKTRDAAELGVLDGYRAQARKATLDEAAAKRLAAEAAWARDYVTARPDLTNREINQGRSRKSRDEFKIEAVLAEADALGYIVPVDVVAGNGRVKTVWRRAAEAGAA